MYEVTCPPPILIYILICFHVFHSIHKLLQYTLFPYCTHMYCTHMYCTYCRYVHHHITMVAFISTITSILYTYIYIYIFYRVSILWISCFQISGCWPLYCTHPLTFQFHRWNIANGYRSITLWTAHPDMCRQGGEVVVNLMWCCLSGAAAERHGTYVHLRTYIYSACEGDVYYIGRVGTMQEGLAGLTNSLPLRVCLYKTMLHCT